MPKKRSSTESNADYQTDEGSGCKLILEKVFDSSLNNCF